jgi:hypothetical protein
LKKPSQNRASGVAQGEVPEFKTQYCKKKERDFTKCNNIGCCHPEIYYLNVDSRHML